MPVVRPDGMLVIPYAVFLEAEDQIAAVVSQDGGQTFSAPRRVSGLEFESAGELRAPPMPTVDVDKAGKLYMVWADARTREDGVSRDVVFATSSNGIAWTESVRLPLPLQQAAVDVDYFTPAIAVAPGTSGAKAKIAVAFYSKRLGNGCETLLPECVQQIDAWLMRSDDGGTSWNAARLLSAEPMRMDWLADTSLGRMLGDYISVSWAGGTPFAVLPLATGGVYGFSEATFAASAS
jgi:hypothetical protein